MTIQPTPQQIIAQPSLDCPKGHELIDLWKQGHPLPQPLLKYGIYYETTNMVETNDALCEYLIDGHEQVQRTRLDYVLTTICRNTDLHILNITGMDQSGTEEVQPHRIVKTIPEMQVRLHAIGRLDMLKKTDTKAYKQYFKMLDMLRMQIHVTTLIYEGHQKND